MSIKAISFNIRCCDDDNGNSINERAPRLKKILDKYDADVIGFQEFTPPWEEHIEKNFANEYEIFYIYRTNTGHIETAPILWKKDKFNCIKKGYFWLSDTPEVMSGGWDTYGHNRIVFYALLENKTDGKKFAFFNTHFGFGEENQVKSVKLIQEYMDKYSDYPTFITGDFNMIAQTKAYAEMVKKYSDVNELTVKDRRTTFHAYYTRGELNAHIDFCFINDKVSPIEYKIIDDLIDGKFPSDHYGIFTELNI